MRGGNSWAGVCDTGDLNKRLSYKARRETNSVITGGEQNSTQTASYLCEQAGAEKANSGFGGDQVGVGGFLYIYVFFSFFFFLSVHLNRWMGGGGHFWHGVRV